MRGKAARRPIQSYRYPVAMTKRQGWRPLLVPAAAAVLVASSAEAFQQGTGKLALSSARAATRWGGTRQHRTTRRQASFWHPEFENSSRADDEDDDDDDDHIDADSLGNWRTFRKNLAQQQQEPGGLSDTSTSLSSTTMFTTSTTSSSAKSSSSSSPLLSNATARRSGQNEELLASQNAPLAQEYRNEVWAHETSTPEVGGLVVRMPLEVELYRNHKHSVIGKKLRQMLSLKHENNPTKWYPLAQRLVEDAMLDIAGRASEDGHIDASKLDNDAAELLHLFLENQETWQEVCLVLEQSVSSTTTLVLNRPMALKLTHNLAQLVLLGGAYVTDANAVRRHENVSLQRFLQAFGPECAVYIGGPEGQDQPAELLHGIRGLKGAVEISPGCGIYRGGLAAAVEGVLAGVYQPLDFRFFVGHYAFGESRLHVATLLGKYQPIAAARTMALKQCVSLPKPLFHEVLELCGGEMEAISNLEKAKRGDLKFQVIDDDDDMEIEGIELGDLTDDLDELEHFDDDDDDDNYYR